MVVYHQRLDVSAADLAAVEARLREITGVPEPVEDAYPLSPLQEGMLFHALGSDDDDMYIVQQRLEIEGALDPEVFEAAWSRVVDRHPALRTVFSWAHEGPAIQIVCRGVDIAFSVHDVEDDQDPESVIESHFAADRQHRFSLDQPPLMRVALFRLAPDRHVMMWSQHHLVEDGWSAATVLAEVFAAYEALAEGAAPAFSPVRPFADFIGWLSSRDDEPTEQFWRAQLRGFEEPTRMVVPHLERSGGGFSRRLLSLAPEMTGRIEAFAREHGLTTNTVLTGALAIVVGRHLNKRDVAIGVVGSGRPAGLEGVEAMVGMFINTLILRLEVDEAAAVGKWLTEVQDRQAAVLDHGHTAMTKVQEWSELGAGTTLTDTLFAYWNFGAEGASPSGALRYRTVDAYGRTSFPLSITVESADPLNVALDFDSGDFNEGAAKRLLDHYATVLEALVRDGETTVGDLEMLTARERARIDAFNATLHPLPHPSVVDAFRAQVRTRPDAVAVRAGDETLTYGELDAASDRLAAHLIQMTGFAAKRIAVLLPRSPQLLVAVLAVLKAGAAYVPVDRHLPAERIAYLLDDSGADLVITDAAQEGQLPETAPPHMVVPQPDDHDADIDFDIPIGPGDLAYVMYTSGSTGRPKGVMVTHHNLVNYVTWAHDVYGHNEPVSFPLYTSVGFDLTVTSMYVPLVSGGEVVIYPDDDARELAVLDVFDDDAVDVVKLTPSHLAALDASHLDTRRIGALVLGGEDLRVDLATFTQDASGGRLTIYNEYGPTEATVGCMIHRYDPATDTDGSVPIGRPAGNARIYVLDIGLNPVPEGAVGELYIGGDGVAAGYLNRDALTADRFTPDPFHPGGTMYRTGDLARWRGDVIEYLGRTDAQVKVRGHRIELGEIEAALMEHPAVANAAVALREARPGDQRLVAYYVAEPAVAANVTELREHLRKLLPEYMLVQHLVRLDALPLTTNGKLDRAALPDTVGEVTTSTMPVAPETDAERLVARLAADLLDVPDIDMNDNFFELGGHSILAMQLIARLHRETGHRLSPRVVLMNTLGQAAAQLPGAMPSPRHNDETASTTTGADAVATTAFSFGPASSPLFGILYTPAPSQSNGRAVLLCAPLGWEYMRSHWAMRKIARLAATRGFHVLRFDYFATGDSSGDRGMGSVDRWRRDVQAAATELRAASGAPTASVVGARLGATLAAAACVAGLDADRLVMWDPVVAGAAHLATLERLHGELLALRGGRPPNPRVQGDELVGFPYPVSLRRELAAVDLMEMRLGMPTVVVATEALPEYEAMAHAMGPATTLELVSDPTGWGDVASTQASLLPAVVPGRIVDALGAGT